MQLFFIAVLLAFSVVSASTCAAETANAGDYPAVHAIFEKYCLDCHESKDPEANLVLDSYEALMKGGESGTSVIPGKSDESLLVRMIEGKIEKDGKKKVMPPGSKRKKLEASEIAMIRAWIDGGAKAPAQTIVKQLVVPRIPLKREPPKNILALDYAAKQKLIAVAHYGEVELISAETRANVRTLSGHTGNVNSVAFSADGVHLFSVSGENALFGEAKQWRVTDGALVRSYEGHKDAMFACAISPDGKTLATGSYDQKIKLWDTASGKEIATLSGHNGAVFGLAFRPDGKILASASADRTVKLWNVAKAERTDTLQQPLQEVYCVAWSPDGRKLYGGSADNRIRVWQVSDAAVENTDPMIESKFAHEGAILRLITSSDGKLLLSSAADKTVKIWDASSMRERLLLEKQPDWVSGLGLVGQMLVAGRMDGTLGFYDLSGKLKPAGLTTASTEQQSVALPK